MSYTITPKMDADGTLHLQYHGDAQTLVDHCADFARGMRERPTTRMPNRRKIMSVPPEVMMKVAIENGIDFHNTAAIWKILKGRDYSKFRCVDDGLLFGHRRQSKRSGVVAIKR